jgi:hypothetical protein
MERTADRSVMEGALRESSVSNCEDCESVFWPVETATKETLPAEMFHDAGDLEGRVVAIPISRWRENGCVMLAELY